MIDGYRELWQAVLMQIISDALLPDHRAVYENRVERDRSRDMLERGGAHFNRICMFAGMDPQAVKDAYRLGKCSLAPSNLPRVTSTNLLHRQTRAKELRQQGLKTREIAAILGLSEETVRKYLRT